MLKQEYGIEAVVHSDIFLDPARKKKEKILEEVKLEGVWPIWMEDTSELLEEFENYFQGVIICVNPEKGPERLVGKKLTDENVSEFEVDPCGEKGEFHSFVFDSSYFKRPIKLTMEETVEKETEEGKSIYQSLKPVEVDVFSSDRFNTGTWSRLEEKGFEVSKEKIEFKRDRKELEEEIRQNLTGKIAVGHCFSGTILLKTEKGIAIDPPNLEMNGEKVKAPVQKHDRIISSEEMKENYSNEATVVKNSEHGFEESAEALADKIELKIEENLQNSSKLF
jgi:hypothetical protein